jgi:hypothetical protein
VWHVCEIRQVPTGFWWVHLRGKRPVGRPRRRWEGNNKLDLQEVRCTGMEWFDLAEVRDRWRTLVNAVMNFRFPLNAGNFLTS